MIVAREKHCNELARVWAGTGRQEVLGGRMQAPGSSDHAASWQKEATSKRSTRVQQKRSSLGNNEHLAGTGRLEVLEGARKARRYARTPAVSLRSTCWIVAKVEK